MRRKLRTALLGCVVSAGLAACSDQPSSVPAIARVTRVNADVLPSCNINGALKPAVRDYFGQNDPIHDIVRALGQATTTETAYSIGMDGLARLALARGSLDPVIKKTGATPAQAAAVATAFLACMPVGAVQTDFATNIVAAMGPGGLFEVPTGSAAVFSRGETGSTFWFAQPKTGTWFGLSSKRVVIFGYKIANIDGNLDPIAGGGFDYNVVPMLTGGAKFANSLLIGVCGLGGDNIRLKHKAEILADEPFTCPTSAPGMASLTATNGLNFAALARKSVGFFMPQPLHAAFIGITAGGSVSELSPSVPVVVNAALTITSQPVDGPLKTTLKGSDGTSVKVLVKTLAGTPLENAVVTLEITGNSGLNALFKDPTLPGNGTAIKVTRPTNESGIADFGGIFVTKAGGYTVTASVLYDATITATPVISDLFNMKNK